MMSDRVEIENVLKKGKKLLSERPELMNMNLREVINELDDGTQQMIHDRWGVAAWLVVNSIKNFEIPSLVEQLSKVDSGVLTYEYAGYLLQAEYHVDLEELLLEADQQGEFDEIVRYVCSNLVYEKKLSEQNVCKILDMMERHMKHNSYLTFLVDYAKHITNMRAECMVVDELGDLRGQTQYDFMRVMRWDWYKKDVLEASAVIGQMLKHGSTWSKKAAIAYWESSLYYDITIFQRYFPQIESMIFDNDEFWLMAIPVFVKYIVDTESHIERKSSPIYHQVIECLENIKNGSIEEKSNFIETLQYEKDIPKVLNLIIDAIVSQSFDKNRKLLDLLDTFLYSQMQNGRLQLVLKIMLKIFISNNCFADYNIFFGAMDSVKIELLKYKREVTEEALFYMLSNEVPKFFFGIGLLMTVGDIRELNYEDDNYSNLINFFTDEQLIHLMKGILYYGTNEKRICHIAFQFLELLKDSGEEYIKFCIEEVYGNYPGTMNELGKQYITAKVEKQVNLAELVMKKKEQLLRERAVFYEIKDLQPSREHQYFFQRAQMEINCRINKDAKAKSLFAQLFSSKTLKYGVRTAYVAIGRKDEKFFQVSPFVQHKSAIELPANYVKDPVTFGLKRKSYLEEVKQSEIGYKGLSTSVERKG